jgi:hypothetical protein
MNEVMEDIDLVHELQQRLGHWSGYLSTLTVLKLLLVDTLSDTCNSCKLQPNCKYATLIAIHESFEGHHE